VVDEGHALVLTKDIQVMVPFLKGAVVVQDLVCWSVSRGVLRGGVEQCFNSLPPRYLLLFFW
jgi:hypothetical protein